MEEEERVGVRERKEGGRKEGRRDRSADERKKVRHKKNEYLTVEHGK